MLSPKKKVTPAPTSRKKDRKLTPIDKAWEKACAACLISTPEEEKERQKRIAEIKKMVAKPS